MQLSFNALVALALVPAVRLALGQVDPGPSPTNSFGCEPHDDHWHCDGPITATTPPVITSAPVTVPVITTTTQAAITTSSAPPEHDDDHDHDHDEEEDHDEDDHDHPSGTASLAPSPTNSFGCEPHGDHWHCEGPKTTSLTSVAPTRVITNTTAAPSTGTSTTSIRPLLPTGGAVALGASVIGGILGLTGAFIL